MPSLAPPQNASNEMDNFICKGVESKSIEYKRIVDNSKGRGGVLTEVMKEDDEAL
jgi:hypothetical protein